MTWLHCTHLCCTFTSSDTVSFVPRRHTQSLSHDGRWVVAVHFSRHFLSFSVEMSKTQEAFAQRQICLGRGWRVEERAQGRPCGWRVYERACSSCHWHTTLFCFHTRPLVPIFHRGVRCLCLFFLQDPGGGACARGGTADHHGRGGAKEARQRAQHHGPAAGHQVLKNTGITFGDDSFQWGINELNLRHLADELCFSPAE